MLDILFVCSPSSNLAFPMMRGPESNQQRPEPTRRGEPSSGLCPENSGKRTSGNKFQEGTRSPEGRPGPEENPGQANPTTRGSKLHQTLQYYRS